MTYRSIAASFSLLLTGSLLGLVPLHADEFAVKKIDGGVEVTQGGKLVTRYHVKSGAEADSVAAHRPGRRRNDPRLSDARPCPQREEGPCASSLVLVYAWRC